MNLNFDKLLKLLQNKKFDETNNKENLILILGNTHAGKSTLINYLLENLKLCTNSLTKEIYYDRENNAIGPEIGVSMIESKTKSVSAYECFYSDDFTSSAVLCDFPGFSNTDSLEENIVLALSIQYLMNKTTSFTSILIVISEDDIRSSKASCFKNLLNVLHDLFSDIDKIKDSIFFLFNKSRHGLSWEICKDIFDNSQSDDLNLLKLILDNKKSTASINFETNQTKKTIFEFLSSRKNKLPIELINFKNYDLCLKNFNISLNGKVEEINTLLDNEIKLINDLASINNNLSRLADETKLLHSKKNEMQKKLNLNMTSEEFIRQIISIEEAIKNYKSHLEEKTKRIPSFEEDIDKLQAELISKNSEETMEYEPLECFEEFRQCFEVFRWSKHTFDYDGIPFLKASIIYKHDEGKTKIVHENKLLGKFKAIYTSNWDKPGYAKVIFEVKKKDLYKRRIEFLKKSISEKNAEKSYLIVTLDNYKKKIDEQHQRIEFLNEQKIQYENLRVELKTIEEEIIRNDKDIEHKTSTQISITNSLKDNRQSLDLKENVIKCIQFLFMNFPESYRDEIHFKLSNLITSINKKRENLGYNTLTTFKNEIV